VRGELERYFALGWLQSLDFFYGKEADPWSVINKQRVLVLFGESHAMDF
jgi:hypothetical protein